jgi:hypothetical protein
MSDSDTAALSRADLLEALKSVARRARPGVWLFANICRRFNESAFCLDRQTQLKDIR